MTLTNAHTHLELTNMGHLCPNKPVDFFPWIVKIAKQIRKRTISDLISGVERGIAELQQNGTTHIGDITYTWLSPEPLMDSGLHGIVYLEVLGMHKPAALQRLEETKKEIRRLRKHPKHGRIQVGLTIHAPYTCHPDLFRFGAAWCREEDVPLCVHIAETPAEARMLMTGEDPYKGVGMYYYISGIAERQTSLPKGISPIKYLESLGVLEAKPLLVHAVQVDDEDIRTIADAGCAIAHCPRSNHLLSCGRMPLEKYLEAGVPVFLGTDSRASSPDLDIRAEAAFAAEMHQGFVRRDDVEILLSKPLIF